MNLQTLWTQSRFAAPYLRARFARSPLFKKVVSLLESMVSIIGSIMEPCRIPVPVPVTVPVRRGPRAMPSMMIALLGTFSVGTAHAQAWDVEPNRVRHPSSEWNWSTDGRLVEVSIQVEGSQVPLYTKSGAWDRSYFQAFRGRNYAVVVRNTTGRRVGVLLAVDGLNVVNGERTRMGSNEAMYVLDPYESATIRGWRTSLNEVRRFVFVDEERSYAERTGQANGDMGWIRVHAFRENRPLAWIPDYRYKDDHGRPYEGGEPRSEAAPEARERDASPQKGAQPQLEGRRSMDDSNPGTGWGERRHDQVQRTDFRAERTATDRITMRYEYASGLRALGIYPVRRGNRTYDRERGDLGFSQPPRW